MEIDSSSVAGTAKMVHAIDQARLNRMTRRVIAALEVLGRVADENIPNYIERLVAEVISAKRFWDDHRHLAVHPLLLSASVELEKTFEISVYPNLNRISADDPRISKFGVQLLRDLGSGGADGVEWWSAFDEEMDVREDPTRLVLYEEGQQPAGKGKGKDVPSAAQRQPSGLKKGADNGDDDNEDDEVQIVSSTTIENSDRAKTGKSTSSHAVEINDNAGPFTARKRQRPVDGNRSSQINPYAPSFKRQKQTFDAHGKHAVTNALDEHNLCDDYVRQRLQSEPWIAKPTPSVIRCNECNKTRVQHQCIIVIDPKERSFSLRCTRCKRNKKRCSLAPEARSSENITQKDIGMVKDHFYLALLLQVIAKEQKQGGLVLPRTPEDAVRMLHGCHPDQNKKAPEGESDHNETEAEEESGTDSEEEPSRRITRQSRPNRARRHPTITESDSEGHQTEAGTSASAHSSVQKHAIGAPSIIDIAKLRDLIRDVVLEVGLSKPAKAIVNTNRSDRTKSTRLLRQRTRVTATGKSDGTAQTGPRRSKRNML